MSSAAAKEPVPLLRSRAIPEAFRHGFTTRAGGVSEGAYATLNLGGKWGDDPERVRENRERLLRAAHVPHLYSVKQVHGAGVVEIESSGADSRAIASKEGDALCARGPGIALAVYTADCVPLLLCDERTSAVAAAHAGWRGTVAGVAQAAVLALERSYGARPSEIRVALGPSIGPCCFEVGEEVARQFPEEVVRRSSRASGRPTVDLRAALLYALARVGVDAAHIDADPPCTHCDRERFFSFRRDGRETGQHVAFIARKGES